MTEPTPTNSGERLNRFLARAGVSSRRGAEDLMAAERVSVQRCVVREPAPSRRRPTWSRSTRVRVGVTEGRMS